MRKASIRTKVVLLFLALALLLVTAVGLLAYVLNYGRLVAQYGDLASSAAELAATEINGDAIAGYLANGADVSYYITESELKNIKSTLDLRFLYVSVPYPDVNDAVYVFDISLNGENMTLISKLGDHSGVSDVYDITSGVMKTGQTATNKRITRSEFGYLLSAYAPLKNSVGETVAVVGVDINMQKVIVLTVVETLQLLALMTGVIVLFVLLALMLMNRSVVKPIKRLSQHMAAFDKNADTLALPPISTNARDEIGVMAQSFNSMAENIRQYVENLRAVTADKQRIATELNVANTIQASMLPRIFPYPPDRKEFSIYATMEPAKSVGGDFYDFYILHGAGQTGTHLAFVIADVSGKGIPAALFMAITQSLLKTRAMQGESPAQIFTNLNDQLCQNNDAGMFVTAYMGLLELATGKLLVANAGHNPPLIRHRNGRYEWLRQKSGFVLAGMENMRYTDFEMNLQPGDRLFLYTDGVTEALNPAGELYGEQRLEAALNDSDAQPAGVMELLPRIKQSLDAFARGAEQADDITMLAMDWYGAGEHTAEG
ncbi:MAG TPA: SpoIIE family protein phosphatase [Candidatus Limiplasma sp.]|nr:SpoIIE family protein phosphatase [Candidatus Limiplasma sp.]HPS81606.1 SpoIIE family protein phosphatase [Candidatus Limiplasma sp.]